ncbi:hypothetical protein BaRGS_00023807 [Batillaria attramentaria]|uniref:Uncharacterized protein n=1 Tax=Batillaria attramentaria TaxID=370345 RepID=A0ABD0KCY5_9CAEN
MLREPVYPPLVFSFPSAPGKEKKKQRKTSSHRTLANNRMPIRTDKYVLRSQLPTLPFTQNNHGTGINDGVSKGIVFRPTAPIVHTSLLQSAAEIWSIAVHQVCAANGVLGVGPRRRWLLQY